MSRDRQSRDRKNEDHKTEDQRGDQQSDDRQSDDQRGDQQSDDQQSGDRQRDTQQSDPQPLGARGWAAAERAASGVSSGFPSSGDAKNAAMSLRRRKIVFYVALAVLICVGVPLWKDQAHRAEVGKKLTFVNRWAALDAHNGKAFWRCTVGRDPNELTSAEQVRKALAAAAEADLTGFIKQLEACSERLQKARDHMASLPPAPAELQAPLRRYLATLTQLEVGLERLREQLARHNRLRLFSRTLQAAGEAWHTQPEPDARTYGFHRFIVCAIPGVQGFRGPQPALKYLAEQCYRKDAAPFADRLFDVCRTHLKAEDISPETADSERGQQTAEASFDTSLAAAPPQLRVYKRLLRTLYESDRRLLRAFADCLSRATRKRPGLRAFVAATAAYKDARVALMRTGRDIAETL